MARRSPTPEPGTATVDEPDPESPEAATDGFWAADALVTDANEEALAHLLDGDHDPDAAARATRSYMGSAVGEDEGAQLARWAESKACKGCRRQIGRDHDPAALKHDDCRQALRAARILGRGA
jgi:hypothetical protein